jgi:hypothetical protein
MSGTLARAVTLKRLLVLAVLAALASVALVSSAGAGGIRDWEPCPDAGGVLTCPVGTEGVPYSIKFRAVEEPPCSPGEDVWVIDNGSPPPGLTLASDGTLSGTPTQAGTYRFWVEMQLPDNDHCNGTADTTQEEFTITIVPGVPRLVIGPESAPPGTVSVPYSLQMTATVSDPKTWSIVDGALPPGLVLGPTDGLISGMPNILGTYTFTIRATLPDQRTDTKALGIAVRSPLAIVGTVPPSEVGVRVSAPFAATGGSAVYTWFLTGALPPGLTLAPNGTIAGTPTAAGTFPYAVTVTDTEGRTATYTGSSTVAERLSISTQVLRPGKVGRFYQAKLRTLGGVAPATWRIKRGPLPRGVRFDRTLGLLVGTPTRARTYRITVEATDSLRVKSSKTVVLVVRAAKKPKNG